MAPGCSDRSVAVHAHGENRARRRGFATRSVARGAARTGAPRRGVGPRHATRIRNEYKYIGKEGGGWWGQASAYWRRGSYTHRRSGLTRTDPCSPYPSRIGFRADCPLPPRSSPGALSPGARSVSARLQHARVGRTGRRF